MNKFDTASHLANLTFLLDYYEKIGAEKNKWVIAEFTKCNNEFIKGLKEEYDETRTS